MDIADIRSDFPNLSVKVNGNPLIYLDNAATTMKPRCVIEAVARHYNEETSNVHRGVHTLSMIASQHYEDTRQKVCDFINARSDREIVFTSGTTASINLVAHSYVKHFLEPGDEILLSAMEHHSNIVPWQIAAKDKGAVIKVAPINTKGEILLDAYRELLTDKVKMVGITCTSNALGTVNPVKEMAAAAHDAGAVILLDAAQAVSHCRLDVQDIDCDFLAFSGHKMYGPTGIGVLYGKESLLEEMPPFMGGGDMIRTVNFSCSTYNDIPFKFEAGTQAIAQVMGLSAAIDYIWSVGFEAIESHEKTLADYATQKLEAIDGLRIFGTSDNKAAVFSFGVEDVHPHDMGTFLDQEGIAVRTGHHCAQPVMEFFGVPATTRASFAMYNTTDEIDRLVEGIEKTGRFFR